MKYRSKGHWQSDNEHISHFKHHFWDNDLYNFFKAKLYKFFDKYNPDSDTSTYRDIGTGAEETLLRGAPSDYADGEGALAGSSRPSAREISNEVFAQSESIPSSFNTSDYMWVWGQFVDHDIDLSKEGTEFSPIIAPADDPLFSFIPFTRSGFEDGTGENGIPREQINEITPLLDGSVVYGSDDERNEFLRADGGKLKVSDGDLLPFNDPDNPLPNAGGGSSDLFVAGDVRANENAALSSMHNLFVREHNRWVDELAEDNPWWSDEKLYQEAKILVEAQLQAITYKEFLPKLLGENALEEYSGYQTDIDPQIANIFATAAYRLGHTMLSSNIQRVNEDGSEVDGGSLALRDAFFRPDVLQNEGSMEAIFRGLATQDHQEIDAQIIDDVRNFLFGEPGAGGLDLASLNIERGRDHGLSDYNSAREAYGLDKVTSFAEITSDTDLQATLASLYGSVDDIDVFVGGLAEDVHGDSMLGELFHTILVDQFSRIRDADPLWYETRLSDEQWELLEGNLLLSDVIINNTDVDYLQSDVFATYNRIGGDSGKDNLIGTADNDLIIGFKGKDELYGDFGNDELYGGRGKDILNGGAGDDLLNGESGKDYLTGGSGNDIFEINKGNGKDYILDFNPGEDKLDLTDFNLTANKLGAITKDFGNNTMIKLGKGDVVVLYDVNEVDIDFNNDIIGLDDSI